MVLNLAMMAVLAQGPQGEVLQDASQLQRELVLLARRRPTFVAPIILLGMVAATAGVAIVVGLIMLVVKVVQHANADKRIEETKAVLDFPAADEAPRRPPGFYLPGV